MDENEEMPLFQVNLGSAHGEQAGYFYNELLQHGIRPNDAAYITGEYIKTWVQTQLAAAALHEQENRDAIHGGDAEYPRVPS